jgi:hypothetical protein
VQGIAVVAQDPTAREHDAGNVTLALVGLLRPEYPLVAAGQDLGGVVEVQ